MVKPWRLLESKVDLSYQLFEIRTDTSRSPRTGQELKFVVLDTPDWVNIIPLTAEGNVILVKQFRHGIRQVSLETPGGLVEPGNTLAEAARRELLEETGFQGEDWSLLGSFYPQPAFLTNRYHTFLVKNAVKVSELKQDEGEDLEVVQVRLEQVPGLIREGKIGHALVIAGFYALFNFLNSP